MDARFEPDCLVVLSNKLPPLPSIKDRYAIVDVDLNYFS